VANLLERDDALGVLTSAVTDAEAGRGSVVLLFGEAGIGKTSVVRAFCREVSGHARVLLQLTEGNPFFVSEVLADVAVAVPPTVADAVLARVRRLDESTQRGLEQLAVVPSQVELPLARALLGDVTVLGEAERSGMLEVRSRAVAFRHELARRAVEDSLPTSERMRCNGRVLAALLERAEPDLARVVHHAVQAGDDTAVVTHAPEAARRAVQAGAQRQAASHSSRCCDARTC